MPNTEINHQPRGAHDDMKLVMGAAATHIVLPLLWCNICHIYCKAAIARVESEQTEGSVHHHNNLRLNDMCHMSQSFRQQAAPIRIIMS